MAQITVTVPDNFIAKVRKVDFPVGDVTIFPAISHEKVYLYGWNQILNDAASAAKTPEEAQELAAKRLANLASGQLRATRVSEGDPVKAEAMRICMDKVRAAIAKKGLKAADFKTADIRARAAKFLEANPSILEVAAANVAAIKDAEVEVDLGDLEVTSEEEEGA